LGPEHDKSYFMKCEQFLTLLLSVMTDPAFCEEVSEQEWENTLKEQIDHAENAAFNKLAGNESGWRLHPNEQALALRIHQAPTTEVFSVKGAHGVKHNENGRGFPNAMVTFPSPGLDGGLFT
jgi:hypothetical protein